MEHFTALGVLSKVLFVYAFNRYHFSHQVLKSKIDLSKGPFTKDLAYAVKVYRSQWHGIIFLETEAHILADFLLNFLLGCQFVIQVDRAISLYTQVTL